MPCLTWPTEGEKAHDYFQYIHCWGEYWGEKELFKLKNNIGVRSNDYKLFMN